MNIEIKEISILYYVGTERGATFQYSERILKDFIRRDLINEFLSYPNIENFGTRFTIYRRPAWRVANKKKE